MPDTISLPTFLKNQKDQLRLSTTDAQYLLDSIITGAIKIKNHLNRMALDPQLSGSSTTKNSSGDGQKKMDLIANDIYLDVFQGCSLIAGVVSEEETAAVVYPIKTEESTYLIQMDPIDGSANMEINHPVGTIFSIYKKESPANQPTQTNDFLQKGKQQIGAGYIMFGFSTLMVVTFGNGVHEFVYDSKTNDFQLSKANLKIPKEGACYSINEGYLNYYEAPLKAYLQSIKSTSIQSPFYPLVNRGAGACFADIHRCFYTGGIFMLPASTIFPSGKLRLLYECNPLAYLIEQAGGKAIDGKMDILEKKPMDIHEKSPLYIGSANMIDQLYSYLN